MDDVTALDVRRTVVHRRYFLEVVEGAGVIRRRVVDIANGVVEVQIVDTELIGVVDELGCDSLKTIVVLIAFRTHDEVCLTDRQTGEVGLGAHYDLRSQPRLAVVRIGADLVLGRRTFPLDGDRRAVLRHDEVGWLVARLTVGDEDIVDHRRRLLCLVRTVCPSKRQIVRCTIALRAFDLHRALTPSNRTAQVVHVGCRLETDDIVLITRRHLSGRGSDRVDLN